MSLFARFARDVRGATAVVMAVAAPALLVMAGASVDYARATRARGTLQSAADAAALAGASMLRLANAGASTVQSTVNAQATNAATSVVRNPAVAVAVASGEVTVDIAGDVPTTLLKIVSAASTHVHVRAKARVFGSTPTCLVVLDPSASKSWELEGSSITAGGCGLFSDSRAADGLALDGGASISAALTCSSGGVSLRGGSTATPAVQTDCPVRADPLASWPQPAVGPCTFTNYKATISAVLLPGVYCGGITAAGNATLDLLPGVYVLKDGPLSTKGNGAIVGAGVTIFLTGQKAVLDVGSNASVSLTAPALGPTAGVLVAEDRATPSGQTHKLHSRYAPTLLGTVYLPVNALEVGLKGGASSTSAGMAAQSAWTIVIARQLSISDRVNLTLNANFGLTIVPPPAGAVPGARVGLVQ